MSKQDAIRTAAYHKFVELAPKRLAGEFGAIDKYLAKGNTGFRIKGVCQYLCDTFGLTMPQTSPHYNFALQVCRGTLKSATLPARPELCVGLGRPLDKLGGRKPNNAKVAPAEAAAPAGDQAAAPAAVLGAAAVEAQVVAVEEAAAASTEVAVEQQAATETAAELVNVKRKKDDALVLEQVTREVAEAAIETAKKKKQAALVIA